MNEVTLADYIARRKAEVPAQTLLDELGKTLITECDLVDRQTMVQLDENGVAAFVYTPNQEVKVTLSDVEKESEETQLAFVEADIEATTEDESCQTTSESPAELSDEKSDDS